MREDGTLEWAAGVPLEESYSGIPEYGETIDEVYENANDMTDSMDRIPPPSELLFAEGVTAPEVVEAANDPEVAAEPEEEALVAPAEADGEVTNLRGPQIVTRTLDGVPPSYGNFRITNYENGQIAVAYNDGFTGDTQEALVLAYPEYSGIFNDADPPGIYAIRRDGTLEPRVGNDDRADMHIDDVFRADIGMTPRVFVEAEDLQVDPGVPQPEPSEQEWGVAEETNPQPQEAEADQAELAGGEDLEEEPAVAQGVQQPTNQPVIIEQWVADFQGFRVTENQNGTLTLAYNDASGGYTMELDYPTYSGVFVSGPSIYKIRADGTLEYFRGDRIPGLEGTNVDDIEAVATTHRNVDIDEEVGPLPVDTERTWTGPGTNPQPQEAEPNQAPEVGAEPDAGVEGGPDTILIVGVVGGVIVFMACVGGCLWKGHKRNEKMKSQFGQNIKSGKNANGGGNLGDNLNAVKTPQLEKNAEKAKSMSVAEDASIRTGEGNEAYPSDSPPSESPSAAEAVESDDESDETKMADGFTKAQEGEKTGNSEDAEADPEFLDKSAGEEQETEEDFLDKQTGKGDEPKRQAYGKRTSRICRKRKSGGRRGLRRR